MANEPNFRIISIDPGGTTGWSRYSAFLMTERFIVRGETRTATEHYDEKWDCGQMGPGDHHSELYAFLESSQVKNTIIVCERFDFRGDDRSDINLDAKEYIGVVKLFAQERGVDVVWQWPFEGVGTKSFVQPAHLQNMKIWVVGGSREWVHAMDAYRHLLYYITAKPNNWISSAKRAQLLKAMGK